MTALPDTHRDQCDTPVPQFGQQSVCQAHTLLDACAHLNGQWYIQHLRGQGQRGSKQRDCRLHGRIMWEQRRSIALKGPGYLIHAPHDLLELGRAIHECTATTLWDTETLVNSRTHRHSL